MRICLAQFRFTLPEAAHEGGGRFLCKCAQSDGGAFLAPGSCMFAVADLHGAFCPPPQDVYASAVGTTVLQLKEIPPRPEEFDGALCLFGVADPTEEKIRSALSCYGEIRACELTGPSRDHGAIVVRFTTHEAALAARSGGPIEGLCKGVDTLYNERSYDGRRGEAEREDDDGRGWCTFESEVSKELIIRLDAMPKMRGAMSSLPPKILALSETSVEPVPFEAGQLDGRVDRVVGLIERAKFTGGADKEMVPRIYKDYVGRIADTLAKTLAFEAVTQQVLPPSRRERCTSGTFGCCASSTPR